MRVRVHVHVRVRVCHGAGPRPRSRGGEGGARCVYVSRALTWIILLAHHSCTSSTLSTISSSIFFLSTYRQGVQARAPRDSAPCASGSPGVCSRARREGVWNPTPTRVVLEAGTIMVRAVPAGCARPARCLVIVKWGGRAIPLSVITNGGAIPCHRNRGGRAVPLHYFKEYKARGRQRARPARRRSRSCSRCRSSAPPSAARRACRGAAGRGGGRARPSERALLLLLLI